MGWDPMGDLQSAYDRAVKAPVASVEAGFEQAGKDLANGWDQSVGVFGREIGDLWDRGVKPIGVAFDRGVSELYNELSGYNKEHQAAYEQQVRDEAQAEQKLDIANRTEDARRKDVNASMRAQAARDTSLARSGSSAMRYKTLGGGGAQQDFLGI